MKWIMTKQFTGLISVLCLVLNSLAVFAIDQAQLSDGEILVRASDDVQQKYQAASENDTLVFDVGTYTLNLVIDKSINLRGISTAHVVLKSAGTGAIFDVRNATTVIQNFTFSDADFALYSSLSDVTLKNNIFEVDQVVEMDSDSKMIIENNTFHKINSAVEVLDFLVAVEIRNNIFSSLNTPENLLFNVLDGVISSNCFDEDIPLASLPQSQYATDLGLVDIEKGDFHLTVNSICKANDSVNDMGAYGGSGADLYAFPVSGLNVVQDESDTGVIVSWNANNDYRVDGYKIYYSRKKMDAYDFLVSRDDLQSKVLPAVTTYVVDDLAITANQPDPPELTTVSPVSTGKLAIKWKKVNDATDYTIYYRLDGGEVNAVSVGDVDNYTLANLRNGENYTVWLTANNKYKYYFQVVPYIENGSELVEGLFINNDLEYLRSDKDVISENSASISAIPESVEPYPSLPNEGCFIATAAFGFYSHSQVQVLRDFRDNYLLTNDYGGAFVAWYYRFGPKAAALINEYDFLKPIVRVGLYPLIGAAELIAYSVFLFWALIVFYLFAFVMVIKLVCRQLCAAYNTKWRCSIC